MTKFNDLPIGTRLIGAFLLLAVLCAGVGYFGLRATSEVNHALENANQNQIPALRSLGDLRAALLTIQRSERSVLIAAQSKDEATRQRASKTLETTWPKVRDATGRYQALPMDDKEKAAWGAVQPHLEQFRRDHDAAMAALSAGEIERAEKLCAASVPNTNKMNGFLNELCDIQTAGAEREAAAAQALYASARTTMFVVIGAAVVIAVAVGLFFRRLIVRPLEATGKILRAVAIGDLTLVADETSMDEFGQLAASLNATLQGMRGALKQDRVSWEEVGIQRERNDDYVGQIMAVSKVQAMIEFGLDGTILTANENFLKTTGYQLGEVQGQHHRMFVTPDQAASPEYRDFWAKLNRGEFVFNDFKRVGKGGKEVWLRASYNPILNSVTGRPYKVVKFATDITAQKQMEEQVKADTIELQRKVEEIIKAVNALAAGDFTVSVPDLGTDNVGQMARSLNTAVLAVRTALEGVREVSEQLADASGQLSSASEEISSGAQEQASSLEETAGALQEITSTVKQSADNAQQARQLASGSKEIAEKGRQVVSSAVEAMGEINGSSKKIAEIITTIDEIAFQTNLLALNAAVEAARAGEQGRGFAVVATEVRNLAQRSATAAKEIKSLINDSVKKVDAGTELVNKSGDTLAEIVISVKRVTDIVAEIAGASKEQSGGIEQVNKAVSQMDTVTQRNASQTEEMSATAQTLTDQAGQLRDLVARFKLASEHGAPQRVAVAASSPRRPARANARPAAPKAVPQGAAGQGHELDSLGSDGFSDF
ncbi:Methyl-accepting chemotaxis protein II [Gemmata obscuriglobus]|uniref:Chemotaxis protein n=1 Tax=Gemmata obscuriglobus TaxID=114 RepID=A0A2Z3H029_9BACT|nr:methyl-accepting chemotaxis protein [Gemmata obscuriglobus]AWM39068.1 chemotaxis protein [Gemmata obscuriglobus]QEG27897.1 Methyl-accepting chemotaxis protein II [Gemmata obscuriglobus]VTS05320.1 chemotaxis partial : Globin-coupled methyl-accepting chemotaxis protein (Modular protein) OS=Candidatus Nitrospira defluvii GN=cheM PE=3 SV=1: 4HB_MCP_1: HAMP: PAS_9: MCPsignal [Gemmata obscuriglobus UQM 2246]